MHFLGILLIIITVSITIIFLFVSFILSAIRLKPILKRKKELKIKKKYERHHGISIGMNLKQLNTVMKDFKPSKITNNEIVYESLITIKRYGYYIKNTIVQLENNIVVSKKTIITNKGVK